MSRMIADQFEVDENNVLIKYHEKEGITEVVIPDGITKIGASAFAHCENLTSITIPNSVIEIGNFAFVFCGGLKNIIIPKSETKIGVYAFFNCYNLTNIIIPDSIKEIGNYAFSHCKKFTNITIPNSVTTIGAEAFLDCQGLTSIAIPNSVKNIGMHAFDFRYIKDINIYSYKVFSLLDDDLKLIAIISTIKNYYSGKIKYSEEDMQLFKEYIRKNKKEIFKYAKDNVELVNFMIKDMEENFITQEDATNLLNQPYENNAEIRAILLNYINEKFGVDIEVQRKNRLDEYDLGEFDDTNKGKTR